MSSFFQLVRLMNPDERRRLAWILFGITVAALLEAASVASVMPFLTLVANSGSPTVLKLLAELKVRSGVTTDGGFIVLVGMGSLVVIILSSAFNAWVAWAQVRFTNLLGYDLSRRLFHAYLAKDHAVLLHANTAEMGKNILSEIDRMVAGALTPAITLVSRVAVAVSIILLVIATDPLVAILLGIVFGGIYVALYLFVRARLEAVGESAVQANAKRFQVVAESFGALRELRLYGRVGAFSQRFDEPATRFARSNASSLIIGQLPKFVLEPLAFAGIVLMVVMTLRAGGDLASALPTIGLFAFAGYRLMPALQNIFLALSSIRFYVPALNILVGELARAPQSLSTDRAVIFERRAPPSIELRGVGMAYADAPVLRDIDLRIEPNTTVGLVGRTGSGKSTLTALTLGLMAPTSGTVLIDGAPLEGAVLADWQRRIGYVPQDVFLTDDTVAANIALGIPADAIDRTAVERAARLADIHDVIAALPEGYDTLVGERGSRLSGGQRQRIGIARALYHEPEVVVFDEATSGLDSATEETVMSAIHRLAGERTLIVVAHRSGALRHADVVHVLDGGRIVASGTLEEVRAALDGTAAEHRPEASA